MGTRVEPAVRSSATRQSTSPPHETGHAFRTSERALAGLSSFLLLAGFLTLHQKSRIIIAVTVDSGRQYRMYRTHTCGELRAEHEGRDVTLAGWVNTRRDHGGIIFLDLRDETGITQVRFDPKTSAQAWKVADGVRPEFVLSIAGTIAKRPKDMMNPKLPTGKIELVGTSMTVLNTAITPPFAIDKEDNVNEELRLKYRYLDIRRPWVRKRLQFRSAFVRHIRDYLFERGFQEIETPILGKSTPEGARDYLVPSRLHPGMFYALPQSPQQYKQLLMVGGVDKYFQIAPCFRDEDARADRSPDQFYQLDLEMAFVQQPELLDLMEGLFSSFVERSTDKKLFAKPWPRLTYKEAMETYGTDKPDVRYNVKLTDVTDLVQQSDFAVMKSSPLIKAICAPKGSELSRKELNDLTEFAKKHGAKGLAWAKVKDNAFDSPIAKYISDDLQKKILTTLHAKNGDAIFFVADEWLVVHEVLGAVRSRLAERFGWADPNVLAFLFVTDFPLFEERKENGHFAPKHHMFTRPKEEDIALLDTDPHKVRSWQHDMVLNGIEVGGGSLRIYTAELQEKIFELIGFDQKRARQFQHMLEAFRFGAPPHGGFAPGIDRLVMMLLGEKSLREVAAFPKTGDNKDLTLGAPSEVEEQQLKDLHIRLTK